MAGANYMGGRRNSARARTKDIVGRTQKGHFMKQKHQILVRGLRNRNLDDEHYSVPSGRIEDIGFAHAKKDLQHEKGKSLRRLQVQPKTLARSLLSSSSPSRQNLLKRSKILEDLDINEPTGLKATLKRILNQPDLAGLNRLNARLLPRPKVTDDGPGERQKTSEVASSSSSPPSRYDSPTKKGTFDRPHLLTQQRLMQPELFYNDDQSRTFSYTSAHSFSTLAENSAVEKGSNSASKDQTSPVQEFGSGSSYTDSGFSELQFSDLGEKDLNRAQMYGTSSQNTEDREVDAMPSSGFSRDAALSQELLFVARESRTPSPRSTRPSVPPTPDIDDTDADNWLALDTLHNVQPASGSATPRTPDYEQTRRFGVGYSPPDPNIKYQPFVPLTTMLPSYSEDCLIADAETCGSPEYSPEVLMDTEQMGGLLSGGRRSPISESERGSPAMLLAPSNPEIGRRTAFQAPDRRFVTSPTRRSAPRRARFTFPLQYSVCSVLADDDQGIDSPCSRKAASPALVEGHVSSVFCSSPVIPALGQAGRKVIVDEGGCGMTEIDEDIEDISHEASVSRVGLRQSDGTTTIAVHFSDAPDFDCVSLPGTPGPYQGSPQPHCAVEMLAAPHVYDGPDLFRGHEDDEDDY